MKYDAKILGKLALIFFGLLFLVCIWLGRKERGKEVLEGEKITREDVGILLWALDLPVSDMIFLQQGTEDSEQAGAGSPEHGQADDKAGDGDGEGQAGDTGSAEDESNMTDADGEEPAESYLTYGQYIDICRAVNGEAMNLPDYADRYEEDHAMLKSDWYAAYRLMLAHLDTESAVWETTVFLLKIDTETETAYTENGGMDSPYHYRSSAFEQNILRQIKVYVKGGELLTAVEALPEEYELKNVWVMEAAGDALQCFYHQVAFQTAARHTVERERVADLTFRDGIVVDAKEKNEKIHGKLLRMTEEEMEIEGCGVYRIAEDMEVYKLYGSLETLARTDLRIGYADTDFVVSKGQVCASLVSEEEAADRIRVLLKNTADGSNYYDTVELAVDGENIQVHAADLEVGERRTYQCTALTDKVQLHAEGNTREDSAYRGAIECYRTADGMVLVNELPLEEYLYAVVPSEMPASYPLEALKAQAVCARTYAYRYILHAGLPEVGAHVDDTTAYQVYHNISENAATTTAVKETSGILLTYEDEPAQNYYYSTSCGAGTDADIWRSDGGQELPYLQAVKLNWSVYAGLNERGDTQKTENREENGEGADAEPEVTASEKPAREPMSLAGTDTGTQTYSPEDLSDEEKFCQFITATGETDLEKEEPWYRWTYTADELDVEAMQARIQERYAASPACVLTKTEGDYYVSEPIGKFGSIKDISVVQRGSGGVAEELLIETDTGSYKILSEYNIRSVLCDRVSEVVKQDGSTVVPKSLLPSGFFVLKTGKREENVIGYTLIGGGYGHGVGMSQNGARALGKEGAPYRLILEFFFPGCELGGISHS